MIEEPAAMAAKNRCLSSGATFRLVPMQGLPYFFLTILNGPLLVRIAPEICFLKSNCVKRENSDGKSSLLASPNACFCAFDIPLVDCDFSSEESSRCKNLTASGTVRTTLKDDAALRADAADEVAKAVFNTFPLDKFEPAKDVPRGVPLPAKPCPADLTFCNGAPT